MDNFKFIIESLQRQDPGGLKILYEEYGRIFYSYCIQRWNLSEDDSWEVVYKTLNALVLKVANYTFISKLEFEKFIYKVLINFLRQHYRAKKTSAYQVTLVDFVEEDRLSSAFTKYVDSTSFKEFFTSEPIDNPEVEKLKMLLDGMDTVDRDLLLLRAQNYSYEEIAKLLGIENNQLKVKYHRAKKKLAEMLIEP